MCGNFGWGKRSRRTSQRVGLIKVADIYIETCSYILCIATNCNIVVFMTVCVYRYKHTTALYY